ncbi:hypothetical protein DH2020_016931 [Rehmannia glutinosa]|uniref:DEK C-terminal domain-containing protein n=1 Tax=Rehmannia glutinosa TaxID=99300 RepID=A0ABR0WQ25_REHGL
MGEEDTVSEKPESVSNGNAEVEKEDGVDKMTEAVTDEKGEQQDEVNEMEEDKKDDVKVESPDMDLDKEEASKSKETDEKVDDENVAKEEGKEEIEADREKQETAGEVEKTETKSEEMEEDTGEKTENTTEDKVEEEIDEVKEEIDGMKEEEKIPEEPNKEKSSKKRPRTKSSAGKKNKSKKGPEEKAKEPKTPTEKKTKEPKTSVDKEKEPITPAASRIDRPVRERKSVERLVATVEKDSAKEFHIGKGRGTPLKDIPNVAYKLSRKKSDDTFKLLHTILFGRRGKAAEVKNNISRFSGFVWHDNEEKQMIKVKEKLDKCVKEKLLEFCDVLDVPIAKANTRKEDIMAKLIEFLVEPHATTSELLAEKEQSSKGKKRKMVSKSASGTGSSTPSKGSAKSRAEKYTTASWALNLGVVDGLSYTSRRLLEVLGLLRNYEHMYPFTNIISYSQSRKKTESGSRKGGETKIMPPQPEDESGEEKEEEHEEEDANGIAERSEDEMSERAETEEKESESEEESDEDKGKQKQVSAKSSGKKGSNEKGKTKKETVSKKASPPPKRAPAKSPPSRSKNNNDTSEKKSSGKKKDESINKSPPPKKPASKESTGKKILKVKNELKEQKLQPSDVELSNAICEILKEVDFNTATFTDILKLLVYARYDTGMALCLGCFFAFQVLK